jgi:ribosomal protein L37AE/L43A
MSNVIEDDPCPHCGQLYRIRWIDSGAESDTWQCTACHYEWLIPVRAPTQMGVAIHSTGTDPV